LNSIPHSHSQCELDIIVSLWIFERSGKVDFLFSDWVLWEPLGDKLTSSE
jgi:hypothetical protein